MRISQEVQVPIIYLLWKSLNWCLYDRDLRHERLNALLLVCINRDIFLDYDIIIDIYASKYPNI